MVQHFHADYVTYATPPGIDPDGTLRLSGYLTNAAFTGLTGSRIHIGFEPPPTPLSKGQLASTYAVCIPTVIATVHNPARHTSSLKHLRNPVTTPACADPAKVDPATPAPQTPEESNLAWTNAKSRSNSAVPTKSFAVNMTAGTYRITADTFDIVADLSETLRHHGPGVYSVIILGKPDHMENPTHLTSHPIFWQTQPHQDHPYAAP